MLSLLSYIYITACFCLHFFFYLIIDICLCFSNDDASYPRHLNFTWHEILHVLLLMYTVLDACIAMLLWGRRHNIEVKGGESLGLYKWWSSIFSQRHSPSFQRSLLIIILLFLILFTISLSFFLSNSSRIFWYNYHLRQTRNVLVSKEHVYKLSDFGLGRETSEYSMWVFCECM